MRATMNCAALRPALMALKGRKYVKLRFPDVEVIGAGSALIVRSSAGGATSVQADVHEAGEGRLPLDSLIRVLGTYRNGAEVELRIEPDCCWLDRLRVST